MDVPHDFKMSKKDLLPGLYKKNKKRARVIFSPVHAAKTGVSPKNTVPVNLTL